MEKEKIFKARDMLIENAIKKIEAGEISFDLSQIISNAVMDIQREEIDKEHKKTMAEIMAKTISGFGG